jgi:tRNA 2-selenouridine synthase
MVFTPSVPSPKVIVIAGPTGSGKTAILHFIASQRFPVIDLEALASHRGSVFGELGQTTQQPAQPVFEHLLQTAWQQYQHAPFIFTEQEAPAIGKCRLPQWFLNEIKKGTTIYLDVPREYRVQHIVADYGSFPPEELLAAAEKLSERFPADTIAQLKQWLVQGHYNLFADFMLQYYDRSRHYKYAAETLPAILSFRDYDVPAMSRAIFRHLQIVCPLAD